MNQLRPMNKYSFTLIFLFIFSQTNLLLAQNSQVGINAGPQMCIAGGEWFGSDIDGDLFQPKVSFSVNTFYEKSINDIFSLRTGLSFDRRRVGAENIISSEEEVTTFDYVALPLEPRMYIGNDFQIIVGTGLNFAYLINRDDDSNIITNGVRGNPWLDLNEYSSFQDRFDLGIIAMWGLRAKINENLLFSTEIRGVYDINQTEIMPVNPIDEGMHNMSISTISFLLGLSYSL